LGDVLVKMYDNSLKGVVYITRSLIQGCCHVSYRWNVCCGYGTPTSRLRTHSPYTFTLDWVWRRLFVVENKSDFIVLAAILVNCSEELQELEISELKAFLQHLPSMDMDQVCLLKACFGSSCRSFWVGRLFHKRITFEMKSDPAMCSGVGGKMTTRELSVGHASIATSKYEVACVTHQ
jgi:hypothetical protein